MFHCNIFQYTQLEQIKSSEIGVAGWVERVGFSVAGEIGDLYCKGEW